MKKLNPLRLVALSLILAGFLASCASSPFLENFPTRYIDRSVLLPTGVSSWVVPTNFSVGRDEFGNPFYGIPIPYPLIWQTSLGDNWTVNWSPLPFSINRRVHQSSTSTSAIQLGFHPDNSPVYGVSVAAGMAYITQHKLFDDFAVSWSTRVEPNFFFQPGPLAFNLGLQLHATQQINDRLALVYGVDIEGKYFSKVTEFNLDSYNLKFYYPVTLGSRYSFTKQWEMAFDLVYDKWGHVAQYENAGLRVTLFHYW